MINKEYANRVIFMLSLREMSGYQLSRSIHNHGGHISSGTLVPILRNLESSDLIYFRRSGKRKMYRLTEKGTQYVRSLKEIREELKKKILVDSMDQSIMFYDMLTNLEDVEAIKKVVERFGGIILDLIKIGFKLEKEGSMHDLVAIEAGIRKLLEENGL